MVLDITKMNIHIIKREIFFIFSNHLMNKQDGKKKKKIRLIMYCIIVGALFLTSLCVVALNVTKRCHISFFFSALSVTRVHADSLSRRFV